MINKILIIILATIASSAAYRAGGSAKNGDWWDWMKHSKTRDWGCSILAIFSLYILGISIVWWAMIISFVACWGFISTYMDGIFGYDSYIAHLALVGASFLLYAIFTGCWVGYIIRILAMGLFGLLSHGIDRLDIPHRAVISENIRGLSIIATLPLLLI